jgi:putative restriction endonuclease
MTTSVKTSKFLKVGEVYTRNELRNGFHIRDAALNNGIFKPKGHTSVWLFITQEKTRDRRPYRDSLVGDTSRMEGQTRGRTDPLIESHRNADLELLLFYRKNKTEFPKAGFRYEGKFQYESSEGKYPTRFVLKRISQGSLNGER